VFISLRSRVRQVFLLGCVSGAALLVLAVGQSSAATYPGGGSTFTGSAEGWTGKLECPGITKIIPVLLCNGSAGYTGTAGNPAGSYDGTSEVTLNLLQLFNSEEIATSPTFVAAGSGAGTLRLDRQFEPEGLLNLASTVTYQAYLVDKTTNTKQKAITETIENASPFTAKSGNVTTVSGHTYQIEIVANAGSTVAGVEGIGLLGSTHFRFDNVVLTGPNGPEGPGGNPGANGGDGAGGGNGNGGGDGSGGGNGGNGSAGGVSSARLESLIKSASLIGSATLKGNRLSVKAACPTKVGATCTITLQGMLSRKKPATAARRARVKQGKVKNFAMVVKPAARKVVKTKSKILIKEQVRVGKAKATVYKTLKLVRK
jgi:hypothetical protein